MEPQKANTGTCEKHGLRVAPDGLCTLCRRASAPQPPESSGGGIGNALIGVMALIAISAGLYLAFGHKSSTSEPVVKHGPPLEAQIAAVDKQLVLMRIARRNGELDGAGLNVLTALENKRTLLVAEKAAQDKNQ